LRQANAPIGQRLESSIGSLQRSHRLHVHVSRQ
jgi:hypothetical protein